ncbi:MAG: hypothetical protein QOC98_2433 [Frankiaceae bacterium]|nr:hypothetical protein [Frankiaceae bacterium]
MATPIARRAWLPLVLVAGPLLAVVLAVAGGARLPSLQFLVLLLVLTAGAGFGTAWAWLRWPPGLAGLGRGLCLLLVAVMGGVVSLDVLNRAEHFYSSFADLVGDSRGTEVAAPPLGSSVGSNFTVLTPDWQQRGEQLSLTGQGELLNVMISGAGSGLDRPALVYLPPEFFSAPAARFPAVELIHGFPGRPRDWVNGVNALAILDQERRAERMPPVVAVLPTAATGSSTECVDAVHGQRNETYLAEDVPEAVRGALRILGGASWIIGGLSTGGFCAANLALHHPQLYAAGVSLSGYFTAAQDPGSARLYGHDESALQRNSPDWLMGHGRLKGPPLFVVASRGDPAAVGAERGLLAAVGAGDPSFPVTAALVAGGHNWGTWRNSFPAALDWAGRFLPHPLAPPLQLPVVSGGVAAQQVAHGTGDGTGHTIGHGIGRSTRPRAVRRLR